VCVLSALCNISVHRLTNTAGIVLSNGRGCTFVCTSGVGEKRGPSASESGERELLFEFSENIPGDPRSLPRRPHPFFECSRGWLLLSLSPSVYCKHLHASLSYQRIQFPASPRRSIHPRSTRRASHMWMPTTSGTFSLLLRDRVTIFNYSFF